MSFNSPLRYPGGKGKTADLFSKLILDNNLEGGIYVEPYVGGGAVAIHLLFNNLVSQIVINDKDRSLFAFWHSVLHNTDQLCRLITDTPVTIDNWTIQKEIQKDKDNQDLLILGFSTFFLNRTNRSGILKGGIIGGINQTGSSKIDARFNKPDLIRRIEKIALSADKISLYNLDAIELVRNQRDLLPDNTLFYFDPPYYVKGKGLYLNYYGDKDHQDIFNEISQIVRQKWVVTYDHVPFIENLYHNYRMVDFNLNYCASTIGVGTEYMIFSDNTLIPDHPLIHPEIKAEKEFI